MAQAPNGHVPRKRTARDYQFGTKIGEGSYSTVYLALDLYTNKTYAIKVLSKKHIVKEDKIKYVNIEKTTLHRLGQQHPGIVQLYYTFQDDNSLFFALDFAEYGELLLIIAKFGLLLEPVLRFYMAQIVDAVSFIHLKGVIHRDLKPENILVGYDFNLKITDFGAAKLLGDEDDTQDEKINYDGVQEKAKTDTDRKGSFVGTAEYVPPELLQHNTCGFETDIWAMGCILYQFFHGLPPFKGSTEYLTFEKIIALDFTYRSPMPQGARDIVDRVLVYEPQKRLTIPQIQEMPWFGDVVWERDFIWGRKVPRFEPYVAGQHSALNYNANFSQNYKPHMAKSKSNYQLSQITYDYNLPAGKKLFQPPTRIKKGLMPQTMHFPPKSPQQAPPLAQMPLSKSVQQAQSPGPPLPGQSAPKQIIIGNQIQLGPQVPQQLGHPPQKMPAQHSGQLPGQLPGHSLAHPGQFPKPAAGRQPWKPHQANGGHPYNQLAPAQLHLPNGGAAQSPNASGQNGTRTPTQGPILHQGMTGKPGQESLVQSQSQSQSQSVPVLEKKMSESQIAPRSPQRTNLRANTAFAKAKVHSVPASAVPLSRPPRLASAAAAQASKSSSPSPPPPSRVVKTRDTPKAAPAPKAKASNTVTFREISSFLEPGEKIIKLDTILKLTLSNRLINRKPGSLDDSSIETLIRSYQEVLDQHMAPVVACVSNKARVFLVDASLGVMLVDLTANKGGDYLMYDYEFESVLVDDDASDLSKGEEVYGYLILELIKEGGDLIFLKRFSDLDRQRFKEPTQVVGKSGDQVRLGVNLGWIDCLIYAKGMVDKEAKEGKETKEQKTEPPKKTKTTKKVVQKKPQRPARVVSPPQDKKNFNKFALSAAAAAAHR